jgi:protoporphyrinogen oxidase
MMEDRLADLMRENLIVGAGVTGLAAAWESGAHILEAQEGPGGLCASYYVRAGTAERQRLAPAERDAYRFEVGGGHWIFGGDPQVVEFLKELAPLKSYRRRAAVFFPDRKLLAPYPLQNHLDHLGPEIASKALEEMRRHEGPAPERLSDWLVESFGPTLTELFFAPFHEAYTAGLWTSIRPQDSYKSPVNQAAGYNSEFLYPEPGLGAVASRMAARSRVEYGCRVATVDIRRREVSLSDGRTVPYGRLVSTLPLNRMLGLTGLGASEEADPSTSVLVLNLGAVRGAECPEAHWVYVPGSRSGFHRVGFYSNVDPDFLPTGSSGQVSLYVERAYRDGCRPSQEELAAYTAAAIAELREWRFIEDVEVVSPTWVEVAYTWSLPGSRWRERALDLLGGQGIAMAGRYGKWQFQGIADSLRDGLAAGAALGACSESPREV